MSDKAWICGTCGAVVVWRDAHDRFHDGDKPEGCNCGYGGVHEPLNKRCAATAAAATRYVPYEPEVPET